MAKHQSPKAALTRREQEVLRYVKMGMSNLQIGRILHISPRTVEHHLTAIYIKLKVASRYKAITWQEPELGEARKKDRGNPL